MTEKKSNDPITLEAEVDGRWIGSVECIAGCHAYGATREEAFRKVKALALEVKALALEVYSWRTLAGEPIDPKEVAGVVAFELPYIPREIGGGEMGSRLATRLFDLADIWLREAEDPRTVMAGFLYSLFAELGGQNTHTSTAVYRLTPISGALENGDWGKEGFSLDTGMYYAESERRKRAQEEATKKEAQGD